MLLQLRSNVFLLIFLFLNCSIHAQFAPIAGQSGSTAIYKDSSIFLNWATQCIAERGPMDISQPNLGLASAGSEMGALGMAGDGTILSLGDGGRATLTFQYPIKNGPGADFAVFENAFNATFLELAFVEVSSDGQNFVRFPAISNTDTTLQVDGFGNLDATRLYNFAGKYKANYGTPFDLEELLADSAILDINAVTHVRLVDVVGCLQDAYATRDSRGIKVNDPWSTPFPSSGFDLDAVGVIHQNTSIAVRKIPSAKNIVVYPNPIVQGNTLFIDEERIENGAIVTFYNLQGQVISEQFINDQQISTRELSQGLYFLNIQSNKQHFTTQVIVR